MSRLEKSFFEFYFETCALPSKSYLSRSMQRRESLGTTTKIPRLSTGTNESSKRGVASPRLAAFPMSLLMKQRLKVRLVFQ